MKTATFSTVCNAHAEALARGVNEKPDATNAAQKISTVQGISNLRGRTDGMLREVFCQIADLLFNELQGLHLFIFMFQTWRNTVASLGMRQRTGAWAAEPILHNPYPYH